MGRLRDGAAPDWQAVAGSVAEARTVWRIAIAAELAGCLKGGLDAVVKHVSERQQFGRPLGAFQAIQHRLAQAAVKIEAAYWLSLRAASRRDAQDAALAAGYVQEASSRIVLDLHQFMGAMGLTLEHPLHRWTYRARLLRGLLGGPTGNLRDYYASKWSAA
jgi:alkylation response protein AidB-like acyl-CoA dehydrogenase